MDLDVEDLDRSPRKHAAVNHCFNAICDIYPILKRDVQSSDVATRILRCLNDFSCQYTEHFISFVQAENAIKAQADEKERTRRMAASTVGTPERRTPRPMVAPLLGLERRLSAAIAQAQADISEFYDMGDLSQSLETRTKPLQARVPATPPLNEGPRLTPSKRASSEGSEGAESPTTKRIRASAAALNPSVVSKTAITISYAEDIVIPASPSAPGHRRLPQTVFDLALPRALASETRAAAVPEKHDGAFSAEISSEPSWKVPAARGEDERYLLVTPHHRYQAHLNKHVPFHTQYELSHLIARSGISWDDVAFADFESLGDGPTISAARVAEVVQQIKLRKHLGQKRTFQRTDTSTISLSLGPTQPATGADREMQRIRREAELEDVEIRNGSMLGAGSGTRDRPYGGQITYSFLIDKAPTVETRVKLFVAKPTDSPTARKLFTDPDSHSSDAFKTPIKAGPMDGPDNPLGIVSNRKSKSRGTDFPFSITMQPPRMAGKSFRLARAFGSRRVLSFKISEKIRSDRYKVRDMLVGRVLLVVGRTYRAFWATPEGDTVFAIETGDELPIGIGKRAVERLMPSFLDTMSRFNDPRHKPKQAMAKWSARPQLLFSDTVPVCHVALSEVMVIPDIVAASARNLFDPATEEILTDGCGLMSRRLAEKVRHYVQRIGLAPLARLPSAIQMRYGGSKGLLLLMSEKQELLYPGKDIILRESMVKSHADPAFADEPSMLTLDLVQHSFTAFKSGTSISAEPMMIMQERGVRKSTFVALQKAKLEEIGAMLAPVPQPREDGWGMENEDEMLSRLRKNVYALGGVAVDRQKRWMVDRGISLKVAGLRGRTANTDGVEEEGASELDVNSDEEAGPGPGLPSLSRTPSVQSTSSTSTSASTAAFEVNALNGMPASPAEVLYELLSSGFTPTTCPYVRDKLRALVRRLTDSIVRTFKIPLERSLTAFIVPDPTGLLAPDEVHISLSQPITDPDTSASYLSILGPVLALRSPCKLPTDVQKMKAVHVPQLAHLVDVIVMSADAARCLRSPASLLGGGDYDGDTAQIIWEPALVKSFKNADVQIADTPERFVADNFEKELVSVQTVLDGTNGLEGESGIAAMQRFLLSGVVGDVLTGKYSELHGNAVYELGVAHPETLRLARMFCHVLDARKSGLTVRKSVMKADEARWTGKLDWRDFKKGKTQADDDGKPPRRRGAKLGTFILDELQAQGERQASQVLSNFPRGEDIGAAPELRELAAPWTAFEASLTRMGITHGRTDYGTTIPDTLLDAMLRDAATIDDHVHAVFKTYETMRRNPDPIVSIEAIYESFRDNRFALTRCASPDALSIDGAADMERFDDALRKIAPATTRPSRPDSAAANVTPSRRPRKPDMYRTKEDKKHESGRRRTVEDRVVRLWHNLRAEQVPSAMMGQGQERLRELMIARAAGVGQWAKHLGFLFEMDFEITCAIKAKSQALSQGLYERAMGAGAVVRKREAWEESKPSAKRGRI